MDIKLSGRERSSLAIYCDASNRKYRNNDHYCIAGVILTDSQKALLDSKINQLKSNTFSWLKNPEKVEIKAVNISGKSKAFRNLKPEKMKSFLNKLSKIIFDELKLKVFPLYATKETLQNYKSELIKTQKPGDPQIVAYFIFLSQFNEYLNENNLNSKIIFDEGDDNFKKLLKIQKERESKRVFDLFTQINMSDDEINNCMLESCKNNALQIADLFAYTAASFYAFTYSEKEPKGLSRSSVVPKQSFNELLKRITGQKYWPLPPERLEESYLKRPEDLVIKLKPKL